MLRHHAIDQHRPASRPVRCRKGDTPPTACRAGGWPLWQHAPGRAKPEALSVREQSRLAVTEGECGGEGESEPRSATDVSTNRSSTYADQQIAAQFAGCDFVPTPKKNEADTACQPRPSLEQATGIRTTVCDGRFCKPLIHLRRPTNCCAICGVRFCANAKEERGRHCVPTSSFFGAGNGNQDHGLRLASPQIAHPLTQTNKLLRNLRGPTRANSKKQEGTMCPPVFWSRQRESNPHIQLGKLVFCH